MIKSLQRDDALRCLHDFLNKHSLADGMKVCQSSVLGGNFEATKLSS